MPTRPARILIVDDEPQITRVMRVTLGAQGFDVRTAADADAAMDLVRDFRPDLVITDLAMPDVSGIELCRRVRKQSSMPIIVLSVKGDERSKIDALDAGADDYVTKPFSMNELIARIRASLRRNVPLDDTPQGLTAGDFAIDVGARRVRVAGRDIHLTPKEFDLLAHFARHPGKVLTHRAILGAVWGSEHSEQTEYLRVFVGQLRKKIEIDASEPTYLLTEPWVGYRFEPGGSPQTP
jgi:two-component system, OmpR family, KDP operon response regulator KdpE